MVAGTYDSKLDRRKTNRFVAWEDYGKLLREKRKKLGLTIKQMAKQISVTYTTAWRWEKGHTLPKDYLTLQLIAAHYQLNPQETEDMVKHVLGVASNNEVVSLSASIRPYILQDNSKKKLNMFMVLDDLIVLGRGNDEDLISELSWLKVEDFFSKKNRRSIYFLLFNRNNTVIALCSPKAIDEVLLELFIRWPESDILKYLINKPRNRTNRQTI
jgi:transcriptional regulator with XRE-family HTH domain